MKKILLALLLIATQACFGQDRNTLAKNKKSAHVRFPDHTMTDGSKTKINKAAINLRLAKSESWIKNILNNFSGAELAYSNEYVFDQKSDFRRYQAEATGIKGYYYSQMRFYNL